MKKILIALMLAVLAGCSTTIPVVAKFPEPPSKLGAGQACPQLQQLTAEPTISQISTTININYSTYWQCAVKVETWIEWYEIQKRIYEGIK